MHGIRIMMPVLGVKPCGHPLFMLDGVQLNGDMNEKCCLHMLNNAYRFETGDF